MSKKRTSPKKKKGCFFWLGSFLILWLAHRLFLVPASNNTTETTSSSSCNLWKTATELNHACIEQQIARVYPSHPDPTQWCLPPSHRPNIFFKRPQLIQEEETQEVVGLLFIKNTKAASSTGAGVTLRIAEQVARRTLVDVLNTTAPLAFRSCVRNWTHAFANYRGHSKRNPHRSLLWTIVRQPQHRDVSAFYFFEHARQGVVDGDERILNYLQTQKSGQFRYLHTKFIANHNVEPAFQDWIQQRTDWSKVLQTLLEGYDFIALPERWDESMAVLTLLWNLQAPDVIVLSAKTKGGYDDGKFQKQCHKIPTPQLSSTVKEYLQSTDYLESNLDMALYAAANVSLDKTIQWLGEKKVQERVTELQKLQQLAQNTCQHVAVYPCSSTGVLQRAGAQQSCYIDDSGCGHACVDQVLMVE